MRLLQRQVDGGITLTRDLIDDDIPPYAILSHTWGADDDEVVFKDIVEGASLHRSDYQKKPGYRKVELCAKWAAEDDIEYFWVDSCCIDKSNSTELQEAITSMFRWYQRAQKCYVYLCDVEHVVVDEGYHRPTQVQPDWEPAFRRSRWLTRGWTLQELLAPRALEFLSKEGHRLGVRSALGQLLQEVTGISIEALHGKILSTFSVSERMSWSRGRQTKRLEDKAYSLLGIFDVSMPVIYGEGEDRAMDRLRGEIERRNGPQNTQESHFMVPFGRNKNFVGRDAVLQHLLELIPPDSDADDCQRIVIDGLGGIGKTQIALEAAYRVRDGYPDCSIFWAPAIDLASFENAYHVIGQRLKLPGVECEAANLKQAVKSALSQESIGCWLLIVDNVDDLELFRTAMADYLPFSRKGSLLLTTRNHRITTELDIHPDHIVSILGMDTTEGASLLKTGLKANQLDNANNIPRLLGFLANLPLAIKQASAFMASNTNVTIAEYLDMCEADSDDLIELLNEKFDDRHRYRNHAKDQNPVATTWMISFEYISKHDPQAASYLKFMSLLAEKDIPLSILPVASKRQMHKAIGTLRAYSFIAQRDAADAFDMHRLVRLVMRNWLKGKGEWEECVDNVIKRLDQAFPWALPDNRDIWMKYLPHGQALLDTGAPISTDKGSSLLHKLAWTYSQLGKFTDAERINRQALELSAKTKGREHPSTLHTLNNLAYILSAQGKSEEAEKIHRQVLATRERVLGKRHPDTLVSLSNLVAEMKREESEKLNRQILALADGRSKKHPVITQSLHNLAISLLEQGKYKESEVTLRQAFNSAGMQKHPERPQMVINLASTVGRRGRYAEAEKILLEEMRQRESLLGKEHPLTLDAADLHGRLLHGRGKYEAAEGILRQTLELKGRVLGSDDSSTIQGMIHLACTLRVRAKDWVEAERILREALRLAEKVNGLEDSVRPFCMASLAEVLRAQGRHQEAEGFHRKALETRERLLGKEHPETLDSMDRLAETLREQGKDEKDVESTHRRLLDLRGGILGREHPDTLTSMHNLAETLRGLGKDQEEVEKLHRQALALRGETLGKDHPDTLQSMNSLACALWVRQKCNSEEVEKLFRESLELRAQVLGKDHPHTVQSAERLAAYLGSQSERREGNEMPPSKRMCLGLELERDGRFPAGHSDG